MSKSWFAPDSENRHFYMTPIDPSDEILGDGGFGGPEINGYKVALRVEGKVLIFHGLYEDIRDNEGKQVWSRDGKRSYGERWYDVYFVKSGEFRDKNFQRRRYLSDDWSSDSDHEIAVEIVIDFLTNFRAGKLDRPKVRSIEFSKASIVMDPRNPPEVIEVNSNAL